jgi:uroporphyrinogen decarboxylase
MKREDTRKRFARTLAGSTPGRPMVDYMAEKEADRKLRETLECGTEEELLDRLGSEFFYLPGRDISQNEGFMPFYRGRKPTMTEAERTCPFGIRFTRGAYGSKFTVDHAVSGPLEKAASPREILNHPWPSRRDFDYQDAAEIAERHASRIRIGGFWSGILGDAVRMFGFQRFLTEIALNPELVKTLINKITDVYLDLNDMLFHTLKGKLEVFFFGNDFGSQQGLLMSRDMWYEFYYENIKKLCALAHSYGLTVMMHSCGSIGNIIDDLISAGVDIIDPVQISARGMETKILTARFGGRVVFHGGIDTQHVLPRGNEKSVQDHVDWTAAEFSRAGGYIACGSQLYGPDIPTENIIRVYTRLSGRSL